VIVVFSALILRYCRGDKHERSRLEHHARSVGKTDEQLDLAE
jgi:hypothetical protein